VRNVNGPDVFPSRLCADDIQRRLAIGPRRLYQLIAEGRFPAPDLRLGRTGRRLWNLTTIEEWERAQATPVAAERGDA
jgi:hypothetical protein